MPLAMLLPQGPAHCPAAHRGGDRGPERQSTGPGSHSQPGAELGLPYAHWLLRLLLPQTGRQPMEAAWGLGLATRWIWTKPGRQQQVS